MHISVQSLTRLVCHHTPTAAAMSAVDAVLRQTWLFDVAFLTLALVHLTAAPYTKVEESFSVQATHDLIHTPTLDSFDHLTFPGVVPRSFLGPLTLSTLAYPLLTALQWLGLRQRLTGLLVVRAVLGGLYALTFGWMRREVAALFGDVRLAAVMAVLACCQFHVPFYCTRLLPNVFAAVVVNAALACYIRALRYPAGSTTAAAASVYSVAAFAFACAVFRCDMILLALPCILLLLVTRRLPLVQLILAGLLASVPAVALTVLVDSYYWRRWLWPELSVLLYNNPVEGQYSAWGVSPWHFYFTSALPRGLMGCALLVPLGFLLRPRVTLRPSVDWRSVYVSVPGVVFVCLYSLLAHKELRFILPAFPLFTTVAAVGLLNLIHTLQTTTTNQQKKTDGTPTTAPSSALLWSTAIDTYAPAGLLFVSAVVLALSFLFSCFTLYASAHNYPGGTAFHRLHTLLPARLPANTAVHLSNLACMSGVSRWGEERRDELVYDKREGVAVDELGVQGWEWLVEEVGQVAGYEVVAVVDGLERVDWRRARLVLEPKLWILRKRNVG